MHPLLRKLEGTDHRSIGKVDEVVANVLANPDLFGIVFDGMLHDNSIVRMRSADAVEKITVVHPEYLIPYKKKLLEQVAFINQQEIRWHVAQLFSRIEWNSDERRQVKDILWTYLTDESRIVKTFSMQALADVAMIDNRFRKSIIQELEKLTKMGSPAMQSRGRKLLAKLKNQKNAG
jgi:hypothetical protein